MKKIFKLIIISTMLSFVIACGKGEDDNPPITSDALSTTSLSDESTTTEETTIVLKGDIPNTAGIVIIKKKMQSELSDSETVGAMTGYYSAEEDAKRLGVSKIVVLQSDEAITYSVGKDILSQFNTLLVEKYNCDFVVSFAGIDILKNYYNTLADLKNKGQQIDITMAAVDANYDRLIKEDFLLDITQYLTTADEGAELYNAYSEEMWESVSREGRIYGYDNDVITAQTNVLSCNKDMAERLGLKVEEGFSFYDIEAILADEDISEAIEEGVIPLYVDSEYLYRMLGYYEIGCGIFAKKDTSGKWIAFNGVEDEEFIKLFMMLREYNEKGWLKTGTSNLLKVRAGEYIFSAVSFSYMSDYPLGEKEDKLFFGVNTKTKATVICDIIPGTIYYGFRDLMKDEIYGITSWSEYPEEALKLITLLSTEEELANLLRYGIEDKYYTYRDRRVRKLSTGTDRAIGSYAPVNLALTYPQYLEPDNKQEFYKTQFSKYEAGPFLEYEITDDRLEVLEETYDCHNVLGQIYEQGYARLMSGEYEDVSEAVSEILRMQKEAGIDEYIAAINKEFENSITKQAFWQKGKK